MHPKFLRLGFYTLLGTLGGTIAWSLLQSLRSYTEHYPLPGMDSFIYEGALIGLTLGGLVTSRVEIWNHHSLSLVLTRFSQGAFLGACSGILSFGIGQSLIGFDLSPSMVRLFSFTFLGLLLGVIVVQLRPSHRLAFLKILVGGLGGLAVAVIIEISVLYHLMMQVQLTGLFFGGMLLFLFIGLEENIDTQSYLRILSGIQEGQTFLIDQKQHLIGYGKKNDLILKGYSEIYDYHARLLKKDGEVIIENMKPDVEVFVNYRFANQQTIKEGDIIKLGSALLEYHED